MHRAAVTESRVEETRAFVTGYEENVSRLLGNTVLRVEAFMKTANDNAKALNSRNLELQEKSRQHTETLEQHTVLLQQLTGQQRMTELAKEQLVSEVAFFRTEKTDTAEFRDFRDEARDQAAQQKERLEFALNKVKTCANFMEKYLPLYMQRQMSDFVEYLMPEAHMLKRINWYNEIKIPLLTAQVLLDTGHEGLQLKLDELHQIVSTGQHPPLPGDPQLLTAEEEFLKMSLRNRDVHARARLVIMQMI